MVLGASDNRTEIILMTVCCYSGGLAKSPSVIPSPQQTLSGWAQLHIGAEQRVSRRGLLFTKTEGAGVFKQLPWQHQQIRTVKRGTEYQPKNIKRKRTHGWIKRLSTRGGIEVILRRMLKGRKSLTHWEPSEWTDWRLFLKLFCLTHHPLKDWTSCLQLDLFIWERGSL